MSGASLLRLTLTDRFVGTPLYISPEAARGAAPDPSFDLWALGVTIYESLTGIHPFRAPTFGETMQRIREGVVADPRTHAPSCPPDLSAFLMGALDRDPARRPRSAAAFRDALDAIVRSLGA
jgi:serine/threonine-protein kinase